MKQIVKNINQDYIIKQLTILSITSIKKKSSKKCYKTWKIIKSENIKNIYLKEKQLTLSESLR